MHADTHAHIARRYQRYKILGCSGIAPVKAAGIENVDLTHVVSQVQRGIALCCIAPFSVFYWLAFVALGYYSTWTTT